MSNKCNLWFNLRIIAAEEAEGAGGRFPFSVFSSLLIYTTETFQHPYH